MQKINFFENKTLSFSATNKVTRALTAMMKAYKASAHLRTGTETTGTVADNVAYIEYQTGDSALMVVCNTVNQETTIQYPESFRGKTVTDMLTGETLTLGETATIAAYGYGIYKR